MYKNQLKTAVLLAALISLCLVIGGVVAGRVGLFIGLIIGVSVNIISFWFSDTLVLKMYRAKEADRQTYNQLYHLVEELSSKAKIPTPKIYIIPSKHTNAFATGRSPEHSAVAFTQGILSLLSKEELKGVAAHELSHIKNRDTLISTITAAIAGVISYAAMMARWAAIFGGFGSSRNSDMNLFEWLFLAILAPFIALLIQLAISRSREYLADETGAKLCGTGIGLASALEKLQSNVTKNPLKSSGATQATAHLFIENPFNRKGLFNLFSTHPNTQERVARLREMRI